MIFARKINKIREFYMMFAPKNIFCGILGAHVSYAYGFG